jgi:hypothetical protein
MPVDLPSQRNRLGYQADFTYMMTVKEIKIQDTGKGTKFVADDLGAVLRKIENWHQAQLPATRSLTGTPKELNLAWNGTSKVQL